MTFSKLQSTTRIAVGTIFVLAGAFKLFVPFGELLAQMNVPFPHIAGRLVPLLEIAGGAVLLVHRRFPQIVVRALSFALAVDMLMAIILVGAPGMQGRAQKIQNHTVGDEKWRVPLEAVLLIATLYFAWRGTQHTSSTR